MSETRTVHFKVDPALAAYIAWIDAENHTDHEFDMQAFDLFAAGYRASEARCDALTKQIQAVVAGEQRTIDQLISVTSERDALAAANLRLREGLAYYAEVREYNRIGGDPVGTPPPIMSDKGRRARALLAGLPGGVGEGGE